MKKVLTHSLISLAALVLSGTALAAWPEKPITIVVPAAPGGTSDIVSRILSENLVPSSGRRS